MLGDEAGYALVELGAGDLGGVIFGNAQALADDLREGPERHALAVRQASATMPGHHRREAVDVLVELPAQP